MTIDRSRSTRPGWPGVAAHARRSAGLSIALFALALLAGTPALAQSPEPSERFGETASVVVVEVPVQVHRDGQPVRGLTAEDFEVVDSGRPQEIVGFETIDLTLTAASPAAPPPLSARRHILLLFDLSFSDPGSIVRAREAARQLVREGLHPTDLVGVASYAASRGAELALGFTADRRQIDFAIENLGLVDPNRPNRDPLGLTVGEWEQVYAPGATGRFGVKAERFQAMLDQFRDMKNFAERSARDIQRNQMLALTGSLQELAQMMGAVEGRKQVVFLSEGFDSSILLGTEDAGRIAEIAYDASHGEFWMVDSDERFGSGAAQTAFTNLIQELRRADCIVQAVDIAGVRAVGGVAEKAASDDGLYILANETGGEFYRSYNDLGRAMGEVLERTSVTYLLAIQPSDLKLDGRFHRLKVKLKADDRGTRLVHRPGYYAPLPYGERSARAKQLNAAGLIVGGQEGGELDASVLAAPFPAAEGKAYVPVLIEVDGAALVANPLGRQIATEIYAYAISEDGSIHDHFSRLMNLDLDKVGSALTSGGLKYWGHFDLDPGDYVVRVLVRRADLGWMALRMAPLEVPDFAESEAVLLPAFFPEPPGKWLLTREEQAARDDVPYPFLFGGQPFVPAAQPVVTRGEAHQVALLGYWLGDGPLEVENRLRNADGTEVPARMVLSREADTGVPGLERLFGRLELGNLAAGSYRLEVTVRDTATGAVRVSEMPIRVEGT